jgi:hypothetical protein
MAAPLASHAGILWNEQLNGDFSNDRLHPTPLNLPPGSSELFGRIEDGGGGLHIDLDYFSITIPADHQLTSMILETYLSPDTAAFMGIQPGPIFPNDPETVSPDDLMGWTHFGPSMLGQDLLTVMSNTTGRFTPPLAAGTYTLWVQQIDDFTEYALGFTVDPVPVPGSAGVLVVAAAAAGRRRVCTQRG